MSEHPQERKFSSKPRSKFRGNRVHHVDDDYGEDLEEAEEPVPDFCEEEEDQREAQQEEQASEGDEETNDSGEEEQDGATAFLSSGMTRTLPRHRDASFLVTL